MNQYVCNLPWNLGLFDWLPAAEPAQTAASEADTSCRPVGITAFVEDPRARTAHVWALVPNKREYHVRVDENGVDFWVQANGDGLLSSVALGTYANSPSKGFQRCCSVLLSLLTSWSFQTQRPIALRELLIEDKTHSAKWVVRPQAQAPLQLNDVNVSLGSNPIGSLLALFREGMACTQPAYRFLCYYKILEAWKEKHGPFMQVNKLFEAQGRVPMRRSLEIRAEMFEGKCDPSKYRHLVGKKFGTCFEHMNEARRFLAHPFDREGTFVSLDDPQTLQVLCDLANLAERMVVEILTEEIRVTQLLDTSGTSDRIAASYLHDSWAKGS